MFQLEDALSCLRYNPIDETYMIRPGMRNQFYRIIDDYVEAETGFDSREDLMSKATIVEAFREPLIELAEETRGDDDPDYETLFKEKKADTLRNTLGKDPVSYTIVFPLNLRKQESTPDRFTQPGADLERISQSEWKNEFLDPAKEADETSLVAFLDEHPNDLYELDGIGRVFTYTHGQR